MDITFTGQTLSFFIAIGTGFCLCLFYDVFRIVRLAAKPSAVSVFFQDIVFFAVCALVTFCLLMVRCRGEIRGYMIAGELFGFIFCRNTISQLIMKISSAIIGFFMAVKMAVRKYIIRPLKKLSRKTARLLIKGLRTAAARLKIVFLNLKKHLKESIRLVYNRKRKVDSENPENESEDGQLRNIDQEG
ncbi:MAG TPA: hypothetical protein DEQ02_01195 [Ruminococcaceae bacterium]|nr:hypothetical protein [Oscillospiraceae bacterium]